MYQAFYRKWRPRRFDDVCGQEHITSVLRYETEHGAFSHAYLFCGSRGTGKTTCAKILARAVNCEHPEGGNPCGQCAACRAIEEGTTTDVIEMDAASNNGVDNIRDIRDEVVYAPSALKKRVYIIDEVHMLSASAFNALLKTLEEPPAHVVFILATTELHKLPATIVSRCQRFDFRRISMDALISRLTYIAGQEGLELEPEAARMLARLAQGGMRDAISLLELCAGSRGVITPAAVNEAVGSAGREALERTVRAIAGQDCDTLFAVVDEVVRSSKDLLVFWQDLIAFYRDLLVLRSTSHAADYLDLTDAETERLTALAGLFRKETLLYHCSLLEDGLFAMQKANAVKRMVAELTLVRMCDESLNSTGEALLSRIARLEEAMVLGGFPGSAAGAASPGTAAPAPDAAPAAAPQPAPLKEAAPARRVLRPLRCWMEAVERLGQSDMMQASFCRQAEAYTTETGEVLVRFPSSFARDMVSKDGGGRLRAALSATMKQELPADRLLLEIRAQSRTASAMDEIIEAAEDAAEPDRQEPEGKEIRK